jgi:hypothetical protein
MSTATTFIAPTDFIDGDDAHRPCMPPPEAFGFSTFDGVVVFANIERARLTNILPGGLTLARNARHPEVHPILHLAGLQKDTGSSVVGGSPVWSGMDYREFILFIPFVLHANSTQWHNFVVRMYLDNDIARAIGELFAYRKVTGFVAFDKENIVRFDVTDADGDSVFRSKDPAIRGGFSGNASDAQARLPNFSEIVRILAMPVLGVDPSNGARRCSYFDLGLDKAKITSIGSTFRYAPKFDRDLASESRASVPDGAILLEAVRWTLQFPPGECLG